MQNIIICSDFFEQDKIRVLDSLKNGKLYIYVFFRMLCIAAKSNANGALNVFDDVYFTSEIMSKFFSMPLPLVNESLDILQKYGLIKANDEKYIVVDFNKYLIKTNKEYKRKSNTTKEIPNSAEG